MAIGGATMGTRWRVTVAARPPLPPALAPAVAAMLDGIVAEMSQWEPNSALSRFNRAPAGRWLPVPARLHEVAAAGLAVAAASGGAFDPTHGALADLWGFGAVPPACFPPAADAIAAARAAGGWRRLEVDRHARRLRQPGGLRLDLSGIAKGYAVDRLAALVRAAGIEDALVEIGGEFAGFGIKPGGEPWWVELEAPAEVGVAPLRLALHGLSVATSGDYRRFHDAGGSRLGHTIDPRTGRPAANGLVSVSVVHPSCMRADAWATALTVLGMDAGAALAAREGLAARLLAADGAEHLTPAMQAMRD